MEIKLEITSQALTPKQKGAIVEKLEEIKEIVKVKKAKSLIGKVVKEAFNKLHRPLPLQNENLSQSPYNESGNEKDIPAEKACSSHGQAPQTEMQRAELNATLEMTQAECNLLGETLGQGFCLANIHSPKFEKFPLQVSENFVRQVNTFQKRVSHLLFLLDRHHNKI